VEKPKITTGIGTYFFQWNDPEVKAMVERVHEDSKHTLSGEVSIWHTNKTGEELLEKTRIPLLSITSRRSLAKTLAEREERIDWTSVIKYICVNTLDEYRKGESVVEISSSDEATELEYLIHPFIPVGKPTAIFGDPGSGKSTLLLILAIIASLPWHDNPLRVIAPDKSTAVLYLDYEADKEDLLRQIKSFTDGMGLGFTKIYYRRCTLPIADDLDSIRRYASNIKAQALFVDSTSLAAGGDLNRMEIATSYIRALRELNLTSVSLAHTSKDRESKNKTIIGSVLFEAGFRSVWECRGQEDENEISLALYHRKFNLGGKSRPLGYRISYSDGGNTIEWIDPTSVPEFVSRMSNTKQILELLKDGALTPTEISDQLDISIQATSMALKRLKNKNMVTKLDKQWGLTF
jgi:energy-coupling factor transporter ATP-binding protein EcfA2